MTLHQTNPAQAQPVVEGLTHEVAEFVVGTSYADLPAEVVELGKKSILDGIGLALSGSVAKSGEHIQAYLKGLGINEGPATVIGTSLKVPTRFAAFANGVGIHADDYDDTRSPSPRTGSMACSPTRPRPPCRPRWPWPRRMAARAPT
ncbi:MmgE/PrpD family protein [Ancylobacter dichloromethanicus]